MNETNYLDWDAHHLADPVSFDQKSMWHFGSGHRLHRCGQLRPGLNSLHARVQLQHPRQPCGGDVIL